MGDIKQAYQIQRPQARKLRLDETAGNLFERDQPEKNRIPAVRALAIAKSPQRRADEAHAVSEMNLSEVQKLNHELKVHQIELEVQNEELRRVQVVLAESRDKFEDLYDFAPVGYFTFDDRARIKEVNLTGADLLGCQRKNLVRFAHNWNNGTME